MKSEDYPGITPHHRLPPGGAWHHFTNAASATAVGRSAADYNDAAAAQRHRLFGRGSSDEWHQSASFESLAGVDSEVDCDRLLDRG